MGNQILNGERASNGNNSNHNTYTPKKTSKNIFSDEFSNSNEKQKSKSNIKEGLYAEDKIFEDFENTKIFGFRLDTDPEEREYYITCPYCNKLNLDNGLSKKLLCKNCEKELDLDEIPEVKNSSKMKYSQNTARQKKPRKMQELNSLVLLTNKDTLFDNFYEKESDKVDYDLLMKKILLPYFKIKSRIIKKGMLFKIGEIGFKVTGVAPYRKGLISSKTYIHCNNYFSMDTPIKRVLMITTSKYDNFDHEELKKEILTSGDKNLLINKNEVSQIKHYEFFIRNCEPDTGVLNIDSQITIENKELTNLTKVKIAIIKNNVPQFQNPFEKRNFEDYMLKEYFKPYFLSGVKKYIERGDIFVIEDLEMFILNSYPENGFITSDTHVMFKLGLNKEKCLEKINNADNKFVQNLFNLEDNTNNVRLPNSENSLSLLTRNNRNYDNEFLSQLINSRLNLGIDDDLENILTSGSFMAHKHDEVLRGLPTLIIDENYLNNLHQKKDEEVLKKCVICMERFEIKEILKTLPCFHLFHASCIDEWLNSNNQCPICKSSIVDS